VEGLDRDLGDLFIVSACESAADKEGMMQKQELSHGVGT